MYLVPVRSPADKDHNSETLEQAEVIKAQRIIDLQAAAHGLSNTGTRKQKNATL
ncbi:MAG: site-specific integrase [Bacteroidales bacterium]